MAPELDSSIPELWKDLFNPRDDTSLPTRYESIRQCTDSLCQPLAPEDYVIQSMPDASPVKWHLAHTTWFYETFVLGFYLPGYKPYHPQFNFLFNSYYNAVGPRWPRAQRGLLSRPTVDEVFRYRAHVDEEMARFFQSAPAQVRRQASEVIVLGLNHEQQHQELILTDLKNALGGNPLHPIYRQGGSRNGRPPALGWLDFSSALVRVGHESPGFAFDNETPRHQTFVQGFRLANRLVTNGDFLAFVDDGGYDRPDLWLSDAWACQQSQQWKAPLYWEKQGNEWIIMTLAGQHPVNPDEPVCHVSFYEADAYARWARCRLPTEIEWETAAATIPLRGHFLESEGFHPSPSVAKEDKGPLYQLFGDVWQWTASPYTGYPGFEPLSGALGEYNGKFMCNQMVLRGASCVTPRSHARLTYRNFFPPEARWQFTGIRLAQS